MWSPRTVQRYLQNTLRFNSNLILIWRLTLNTELMEIFQSLLDTSALDQRVKALPKNQTGLVYNYIKSNNIFQTKSFVSRLWVTSF